MKIFFSLLLIANIAFVLVQWLVPYEQLVPLVPDSQKIPVAEKLRLLDEVVEPEVITGPNVSTLPEGNVESEASSVLEVIAESEVTTEPEVSEVTLEAKATIFEEVIDSRLCYTIGPFKEKTGALEVSARYSNKGVKTELKSSQEKEYLGIMVYIASHKDRQAAINTAAALAKKGYRDSLIVNEPDKSNVLSLGVFGLKKNADRLISRLKKLKYPVKSETRYRERTIFWVYSEQSNQDDLYALLNSDDEDKGIGQMPRQCS